jgi:hypothetical protein
MIIINILLLLFGAWYLQSRLNSLGERLEARSVELEKRSQALEQRSQELGSWFRDRTEIHADLAYHQRGSNTIIVIGRYGKREYINVFDLGHNDFNGLVDRLLQLRRYGSVKTIDALPAMTACIRREL